MLKKGAYLILLLVLLSISVFAEPIATASSNINVGVVGTNQTETSGTSSGTCSPSWQCGNWSECINGNKTRTCIDISNCVNYNTTQTVNCEVTNIAIPSIKENIQCPAIEREVTQEVIKKSKFPLIFYILSGLTILLLLILFIRERRTTNYLRLILLKLYKQNGKELKLKEELNKIKKERKVYKRKNLKGEKNERDIKTEEKRTDRRDDRQDKQSEG